MRANFTGFGRRKRGVSEIRCKDTMNKLGFANFFAKKNQKKRKVRERAIKLPCKRRKIRCPDQIRTQGTKGGLSPQWAR